MFVLFSRWSQFSATSSRLKTSKNLSWGKKRTEIERDSTRLNAPTAWLGSLPVPLYALFCMGRNLPQPSALPYSVPRLKEHSLLKTAHSCKSLTTVHIGKPTEQISYCRIFSSGAMVDLMGRARGTYWGKEHFTEGLSRKTEARRPFWRHKRRYEDNIKVGKKDIKMGGRTLH
jgi:hypothetical protein